MTETPFFTTLKNRGQINISGKDRKFFLQSIISNDINLLNTQDAIYSCLLTPQGKFLYDFFITEEKETLLIDCEGNERATFLAKLLNMYKLRADINIETTEEIPVYAIIGNSKYGYKDPRHDDIGYRSYEKPNLLEQPFEKWDHLRLSLTIPDGSRDMIIKKSTLLESNIDKLNGVSFDKGCYIGQEITARMHYRGLVKKHLKTLFLNCHLERKAERSDIIALNTIPPFGEPIIINEENIGEMRSSCGDIGLALIKR